MLQQVTKYSALLTAGEVALMPNQKSFFRQKAGSQESAVSNVIAQVDAIENAQAGELNLTGGWAALKSEWNSVRGSGKAEAGDRLAEKLVAFMVSVGDASNLNLDSELDSTYVKDALVVKLPELHYEIEAVRNLMRKRAAGGHRLSSAREA